MLGDDLLEDVQTSGVIESTYFLAALMFWTDFARRAGYDDGLKSSSAISFGSPHWWSFRVRSGDDHRAAE